KPDQTSQSADSTARNLTLAPTESTAALKDLPAPATEAAKPAPEKKAPVEKPVPPTPAAPAPLMLAAGPADPPPAGDAVPPRASRDIDVVIPKGAAITIKLNAPLTVNAA